ncbi:uncharacterized protein LOC113773106 isoform X1 [Coffea eugenioides]|uniref:uncharacterized protein LOC113773106 isoform X1 n=2 Tax=Coffea eugenioides TaxID=49369 RepID=UPI000F608439|nr:uncharacterized protein LOC113773106 isoform X1 [Coffea eugenioides]XP_027173444.1 uncharacterized protein LOC113773106 isoform X1 [Coffea eugenioides]
MEEDKKKKKNKKRKNKQNKTTADSAPGDAPGPFSVSPSAQHIPVTESAKISSALVDNPDAQEDDTASGMTLNPHGVIFEEKIQILLQEKNAILQKEATLLEKIEELQNEKAVHVQREASLEEQILQLQKEKDAFMLKVDALGQKIQQMQMEKDAHVQKESALEAEVGHLTSEKESWYHKEAHFEEKINHLMVEAATLSSKKVSLEEFVKQMEEERDSWILQENSSKEVIAKLNGDNTRLKSQVMELEELRNGLLQENHLLTENISGLQSQILSLERTAIVSQSSSDSKMMNELYVEIDRNGLQQEIPSAEMPTTVHLADSPAVGPHLMVGAIEAQESCPANDSMDEANAKMLVPDNEVQSPENNVNNDARGEGEYLDDKKDMLVTESSEMTKSDEIVQIPLDENENKKTDVEATSNAEKTVVPLSDAPLIGAPFRLISFVARYVSGADLVEKNSVNLGR